MLLFIPQEYSLPLILDLKHVSESISFHFSLSMESGGVDKTPV